MELKEIEQTIKDLQEIVDNYSGSWKRFNVLDNALSLIKEQQEKIKKLEADNHLFYQENKQLKDDNKIFNELKDTLSYKIAKAVKEVNDEKQP